MGWSLHVGRIAGVDIKIHWSFVFALWYVLPRDGAPFGRALLAGLLALVLVFGSVLLHELGHALAARWLGIGTHSIVLWPLGGFANLTRAPDRPLHDLLIAAAGPLVNLVLAGVALLLGLLLGLGGPLPPVLSLVINGLLLGNLILAGFNLVPLYPLDGGRVARALLQMLIGRSRADAVMFGLSLLLLAGLAVVAYRTGEPTLIIVLPLMLLSIITLNPALSAWLTDRLNQVFNQGALLTQRGEFDAAISYYSQMIQRRPRLAPLYHGRGYAAFLKGAHQQALADFDQALLLNPKLSATVAARMLLHYARGDRAQMRADMARLIDLEPDQPQSYARAALGALLLCDYDQAQLWCVRAAAMSPSDPLVLLARGTYLLALGPLDPQHYRRALADFDRALEDAPRDQTLLCQRGQVRAILGDHSGALADLARAQSINPFFGHAALYRGQLLVWQGQHAAALAEFDRAIALLPWWSESYLWASLAAFLHGDQARAAAYIDRALATSRANSLVHTDLDMALLIAPHRAWAQFFYDHAVARLPNEPLAYEGRADALRAWGEHALALADYNHALALDPQRDRALLGRALSAQQLGDRQRAAADLSAALEQSDNSYLRRIASERLAGMRHEA
ncbi:MAG: hypothetical protein OHK0022_40320 [Roseiflexaceae bacterium]